MICRVSACLHQLKLSAGWFVSHTSVLHSVESSSSNGHANQSICSLSSSLVLNNFWHSPSRIYLYNYSQFIWILTIYSTHWVAEHRAQIYIIVHNSLWLGHFMRRSAELANRCSAGGMQKDSRACTQHSSNTLAIAPFRKLIHYRTAGGAGHE